MRWWISVGVIAVVGCGPEAKPAPVTPPAVENRVPARLPGMRVPAPFDQFALLLEQAGERIEASDERVFTIAPAPFRMRFWFRDEKPVVSVHASFAMDSYQQATGGASLGQIRGMGPGTGFAEGLANKERDVLVDPDGHNHWFSSGRDDHRFDAACERGKEIFCTGDGNCTEAVVTSCTRSIDSFWAGNADTPISDAGSPLYLVVALTRWDPGMQVSHERERQLFRIEFEEAPSATD